MFNVKTRQIILEIPKNGSRSLVNVATRHYTKRAFKHHGHKTLREIVDLISPSQGEKFVVVGVVRHPEARFISQVNHYLRIKKRHTRRDALKACADQSHIIFKPQSDFVELPDSDVGIMMLLYPIEQMLRAQAQVAGGCRHSAAHDNAGGAIVDMDRLMEYAEFEAAFDHFAQDYELYNSIVAVTQDYPNKGNKGNEWKEENAQ